MYLQESEENFKKYKESIHNIKSKKFYERYDATQCEIQDDLSTFIFETLNENVDETLNENVDETLNENVDENIDKNENNQICLID